MMIDFTNDELLLVAEWAMAKADSLRRCKVMDVRTFETTQSIFEKVHNEHYERYIREAQ